MRTYAHDIVDGTRVHDYIRRQLRDARFYVARFLFWSTSGVCALQKHTGAVNSFVERLFR